MSKINKENNFSILHFLGACLVMYGHQWILLGSAPPALLGNSVSTFGVKMIFVITGYLVTKSFTRSTNFIEFIKKRLIRIFPALITCILVTICVMSLFSRLDMFTYFRWSYQYLIYNILLYPIYSLPGVFETNPYPHAVNGSLWTIPVEVSMYFFIGLVLLLLNCLKNKKLRVYIYTLIVMMITAIEAFLDVKGATVQAIVWGTDWISALDLIPYMLLGSLCEVADLRKYCNVQIGTFLFLVLCCLNVKYQELLNFIVLPYFTMSFALCSSPVFSRCFKKNNIAYGVFLWGFPVQQTLIYLLHVKYEIHLTANIFFVLSLAIVVFIAYLSHRFIEIPVERFLKRKLIK